MPSKQKTQVKKKLKGGFKVGELITGRDRSYKRSIYKVLSKTSNPRILLLEFVSLGEDVIEMWKDRKANPFHYRCERKATDFRKATRKEIRESNRTRGIYQLRKILRKLGLKTYVSESISI